MSNMGWLKLHPDADEQICFTVFLIRYAGGINNFSSLAQSNINTSIFRKLSNVVKSDATLEISYKL